MKKIWKRWKRVSDRLLEKEATIVLNIFYFILVTPVALTYKIFSDPLSIKSKKNSLWIKKNMDNVSSLDSIKKQY